jgi:bifunctional DNA-binding transcriptional regulator/antitoxin component of YhaV-PrlF toxin-antitoxin module
MTVVVKDKKQLVVPPSVSRRAGITAGDRLEFTVSGEFYVTATKKLRMKSESRRGHRRPGKLDDSSPRT